MDLKKLQQNNQFDETEHFLSCPTLLRLASDNFTVLFVNFVSAALGARDILRSRSEYAERLPHAAFLLTELGFSILYHLRQDIVCFVATF